MTPNDIRQRLEGLRGASGDPEFAHSQEDRLHQDVLRAIMQGKIKAKDRSEVCRLALSTADIEFPRWYA